MSPLKSPLNDSAATLRDVRASTTQWVIFATTPEGEVKVSKIGRFITGPTVQNAHGKKWLELTFASDQGSLHVFSANMLGLLPMKTYAPDEPLPPQDSLLPLLYVADRRDPRTFWYSGCFVTKLTNAHKAVGGIEAFRKLCDQYRQRGAIDRTAPSRTPQFNWGWGY